MTHSASIKSIVQRNAGGFLNGAEGLERIQVKYYSPTTFQEVIGPNANAGGNIVEVAVTGYRWNWIAPIWRAAGNINVGAISADRLEMLPRGVARPVP